MVLYKKGYRECYTSTMFSLSITNYKNALVTVLLTAVLAVVVYVVGLGDIFKVNWHDFVNIGVLALLNGLISLIKQFLTTDSGKFLGTVKVATKK